MKYIILKNNPSIVAGDVLFCWGEELKRNITGHILRVVKNKALNDYDVYIRWNDVYVAYQNIGLKNVLMHIRAGLWKHRNGHKKVLKN